MTSVREVWPTGWPPYHLVIALLAETRRGPVISDTDFDHCPSNYLSRGSGQPIASESRVRQAIEQRKAKVARISEPMPKAPAVPPETVI